MPRDTPHELTPRTRGLWSADDDTDLRDLSGRIPPKKLMFSLNGKCNLRCDHCPRGVYDVRAEQTPVKVIDYVNLEALWTGDEWYRLRQAMVVGRWEGPCAPCDFRRTRMRELGLL